MDTSVLFIAALLVMLIGLAGTVLPGIPGAPLVWAGLAGFAILDGFHHVSILAFVILTLIAAAGATAGFWSTQLAARAGGASGCSSLAGSCLVVLGLVFFTLPYALLLAILGVFGLEWRRKSDARRAALVSSVWLIGWVVSTVIEFVSALVLIVFFLISVLPSVQ